jgi:hypothetical protein
VKEIKSKLSMITVVLAVVLLASPFVGTITAGKGQDKLRIEFTVGSYEPGSNSYDRVWNCPQSVELPDSGRITHFRGGDWGTGHLGFGIVVDEGGLNIEFDNEEIDYSASFDCEAHNMLYGQAVMPYVIIQMHIKETWVIDNGAYSGQIEILTSETVYDYANLYEGIHSEGSFVGHGVINGQDIKVLGESGLGATGIFREGTLMGWPT